MDIITILLIAIGLAMDAFAVSLSNGMTVSECKPKHAVKMGLFCGVFQFIMPLLGWLLGGTVSSYVEKIDHWIVFLLLIFIGGKMIVPFFKKKNDENFQSPAVNEAFSTKRLLTLAIATSIDALAVGVSFAFLSTNIWGACALIGVVAFAFSFAGVLLGKQLGPVLRDKAALIGGVTLIIIGTRILVEHLFL